jgi:hypothetical protein
MAEPETAETDPKPKGKGGFLKKKVAGIPVAVLLPVAGIAIYYLYTKYKAGQAASTSSTATPTASSGTPTDTSGGYTDQGSGSGGGYAGGTDPNAAATTANGTSPTDTSAQTPAPPATTGGSSLTPIGNKTVSVGGKSFSTVSGFTQNGNTYYGIDNPAEAKRLTALGAKLVQNPNDPNGKGEFLLVPKGATGPVLKPPTKKPPAKKKVKA